MREILFRGKRKSSDTFIYGSLVYSKTLDTSIYFEVGKGSVKYMEWVYVDPPTVGQYTGLNDKNETKIFEGDIVKRESMAHGGIDFIGTVVFREGAYLVDNGKDGIPLFTEIDTLEIIGNIHDNIDCVK